MQFNGGNDRYGAENSLALQAVYPETRYAKGGDVHIAYQVIGDGPRDLVPVPPFVSHIEHYWEEPSLSRFLNRLASFSRLILFDKRGTGLSERVPTNALPGLEQRMDDVRAVLDAVGAQRTALFGSSEGGPMSALFATTYPARSAALILYGTFASTIRDAGYPWAMDPNQRRRLIELVGSIGTPGGEPRCGSHAASAERSNRHPRNPVRDSRANARRPSVG
jgi:pimeloyl-ACP methyl ester carboxylesterase